MNGFALRTELCLLQLPNIVGFLWQSLSSFLSPVLCRSAINLFHHLVFILCHFYDRNILWHSFYPYLFSVSSPHTLIVDFYHLAPFSAVKAFYLIALVPAPFPIFISHSGTYPYHFCLIHIIFHGQKFHSISTSSFACVIIIKLHIICVQSVQPQ